MECRPNASFLRETGPGHAKCLELSQKGSKNTLVHALYRAFQGQKCIPTHSMGTRINLTI